MGGPSTFTVVLSLIWDNCCAPPWMSLVRDYQHIRKCLLADYRQFQLHGILRRKPEKGILRIVLAAGWVAVHLFVLVTFAAYGAFGKDPAHASWWLVTTLLAGVLYVSLMYSDPGVIDQEQLQRLTAGLELGEPVVASDAGRELHAKQNEQAAKASRRPADGEEVRGEKRQGLLSAADAEEKILATRNAESMEEPAAVAADGDPPADQQVTEAGPSEVHIEVEVISDTVDKRAKQPTRARVAPTASEGIPPASEGSDAKEQQEVDQKEELRLALANHPRMVGVHVEEGEAEAEALRRKIAEERRGKPDGISDYFSGYCQEVDMYLPIRAKYCKKHRAVIAKFDHYCYALGNSVGELNHGQFYRMVFMQMVSIWNGKLLLDRAYFNFGFGLVWATVNIPLLIIWILSWAFGTMLSILLAIHTFHALTSSTTYEFVKLEKLEYMSGFYQFSFPFSDGLVGNLRHFCCPTGLKLWKRAPPEHEWPETFWRNRYYQCCG